MKPWSRLKVWWRGVPTIVTELESGWHIEIQNPNHPARARLVTATRHPVVKWVRKRVDLVVVGILVVVFGAVAVKMLGL